MVQNPFDQQPPGVTVTYQVKHLPCSSPGCILCLTERGHGPYWYAQYEMDGSTKHVFLGRKLKPLDLAKIAPQEPVQPTTKKPMKGETSTHSLRDKFQSLPTSAEFERDLLLLKGAARGENLKGVYRKLIKKYHPEQFKGHPQMNRWMSEIN